MNLIKVGANTYQEMRYDVRVYTKIVFIEPLPDAFNVALDRTKEYEQCLFYPVNTAISEQVGELNLNVYHPNRGRQTGQASSLLKRRLHLNGSEKEKEPKEIITVKATTLSHIIELYSWMEEKFDIVIDTEGTELTVLKSLGSYIKNINKATIETFDHPFPFTIGGSIKTEIDLFMEHNGFKFHSERRNPNARLADTTYVRVDKVN